VWVEAEVAAVLLVPLLFMSVLRVVVLEVIRASL
jgi:hypothetical protein